MPYYPIQPKYSFYLDQSGDLLNGFMYLGDANKDPTVYPAKVSWDRAGLYPVEFPITIKNGYPTRDGKPAQIFIEAEDNYEYSSLIQDSDGNTIFSSTTGMSGYFPGDSQLNLESSLGTDLTANGVKATKTVDSNATGFGALLFMASDGNYDEADATDSSLMPCTAMALESGTGSKTVLKQGYVRDDSWSWTPGGIVYASTTTGAMTQTAPSATGEIVQIVGIAESATSVYFDPEFTTIEIA